MRGVGILSIFVAALAVCLGCDDAWARQGVHVAQSVSVGTVSDPLDSAVWAWILATSVSPQFLVGVALGVAIAEAGRFLWRSLCRLLGGAAHIINFLVQHRLMVVVTGLGAGYAVVRLVG